MRKRRSIAPTCAGGVTYRDNAAQLRAEGQHDANGDAYGSARKARSYLDGTLFAARQLGSSFAVVETGGIPDVPCCPKNHWSAAPTRMDV